MKLRAYDLGDTIEPGPLVSAFGVAQATRWEDALVVSFREHDVYVYQFGAVVFFGHTEEEVFEFCAELDRVTGKKYHPSRAETYTYEVVEDPPFPVKDWTDEEFVLDRYDDVAYFNVAHLETRYLKVLAFVLAQSTTLERFDRQADVLEEESEQTLAWYEKRINFLPLLLNRPLTATIRLLRERQKIMSELMVVEKPRITWTDTVCDEIYEALARHFEVSRRGRVVEVKLNYCLETAKTLASIAEASRNTFLEFLITILIIWEVIWEFIKPAH
ncbi:MAG TPA: RMD1 family protein [bacterium]|nr:RMD1 family protein [bacterium]